MEKKREEQKTEVQTCQASRVLGQHRVWGSSAPAPPTGGPEHHSLVPVGHVTVQLPSDALPWPSASLLPALVSSPRNSDHTRDHDHRVRGCSHRAHSARGCPAGAQGPSPAIRQPLGPGHGIGLARLLLLPGDPGLAPSLLPQPAELCI